MLQLATKLNTKARCFEMEKDTEEDVKKEVEKIEYETLLKINEVFSDSLEDFNTRLDNSLRYLDYITLPIIMSSIEEKSYNPFAEIIERYVEYIVAQKMEIRGYKFLPLGYSSDLCFESENTVTHIDIKTANINNPSDFKDTIPLGFNQTSYSGKLPIGGHKGREPLKIYPNLPTEYEIDGRKKIAVTNALLFIYPDYKKSLDDVRKSYAEILNLIDGKLKNFILEILSEVNKVRADNVDKQEKQIDQFLNKQNVNSNIQKRRILSENIVRAYYIQNIKDSIESQFKLSEEEKRKLNEFIEKIKYISNELRRKNIKPIAIISISIPNGKLVPLYNNDIVSGKSYGKSIRYHYKNGIFKLLSNDQDQKSRVVFLFYDKNYEKKLRIYFTNIYVFEIRQKKI